LADTRGVEYESWLFTRELNRIRTVILEHSAHILEAWHDHCGE